MFELDAEKALSAAATTKARMASLKLEHQVVEVGGCLWPEAPATMPLFRTPPFGRELGASSNLFHAVQSRTSGNGSSEQLPKANHANPTGQSSRHVHYGKAPGAWHTRGHCNNRQPRESPRKPSC